MADIAGSLLEDDTDLVDRTIYTTGTVTATANRLVLLNLSIQHGSTVGTVSSVTGGGLTWVEVNTQGMNTVASPVKRVTVFRALGDSPSSGVLTVTLSKEHTNCQWAITEYTNIDTGGENGANAIVQSVASGVDDQTTSWSITLAAFADSANATFGGFTTSGAGTITAGSGFARLGTTTFVEWKKENDTSVDFTFATSNAELGGIAIEIRNASAPLTLTSAAGTSGHLGMMF